MPDRDVPQAPVDIEYVRWNFPGMLERMMKLEAQYEKLATKEDITNVTESIQRSRDWWKTSFWAPLALGIIIILVNHFWPAQAAIPTH